MKEFIKLDKYGQLYIDKILFESYFPIIFTCINDNKDIFIGVCCQNNEKGCKWLLGKTDGISIVNMLQDKITIQQLLLEHSSGKISVDYVENTGYAADEEFEDEINYFLSLSCCMSYDRECYKCALG